MVLLSKRSLNTCLDATHRFIPEESDWGFSRFYDLRKLMMRFEGRDHAIIENDETSITVYLRIVKDSTGILWHSFIKYVVFNIRENLANYQ